MRALDAAHLLHPFSDACALRRHGVRVIVRGDGVRIWDSEGHEIIDAMAGLWCVSLGYGRRDLIDAATRQLETLPYYNTFFQTSTPPAIELAALLTEVAPPGFGHVFLTSGGSDAVDTAVRMVRQYWQLRGQPGRRTVIAREHGYHGSTVMGASLSGDPAMRAQGGACHDDVAHVGAPDRLLHAAPGESEGAFALRAAGWLEAKILELGPETVAAFIGEPVQGSGGVIIPPPGYWAEIQRICDRYGVLLVSDEVICGFGRLGTWFGCQHPLMNFRPDLITFAKGVTSGYLPLGGVLVGDRVASVLIEQGGEFMHGFTYSGHPTCCAVALATVRALRDEGIIERVTRETAPYLARAFGSLADHPLAGPPQTLGMLGMLPLAPPPGVDGAALGLQCREHCFEEGVVMRTIGARMVIAPPLVITPAEIDEMVARIRRSLDETQAGLPASGLI